MENNRLKNEVQRLTDTVKRLNRRCAHEEKQRKSLQRALDAQEAETELRIAALRYGVKDIDYALTLLQRRMAGKTAQELEDFDETRFFSEELRASHPHLYEVQEQPATTSPEGDGTGGGAPKPKAPEPPPPDDGRDTRQMTQEQYDKYLRDHGLQPPGIGVPTA